MENLPKGLEKRLSQQWEESLEKHRTSEKQGRDFPLEWVVRPPGGSTGSHSFVLFSEIAKLSQK